jgi:hypothetical protein
MGKPAAMILSFLLCKIGCKLERGNKPEEDGQAGSRGFHRPVAIQGDRRACLEAFIRQITKKQPLISSCACAMINFN